jgi:chaperone BCS1
MVRRRRSLVEDIDSYFNGREPVSGQVKITFSGLLNAIDGAAACEGRVLFLTTNHRETLDPALIRPGRVDFEMEFDYADDYQVEGIYRRFKPDASVVDFDLFKSALRAEFSSRQVTMAQLQGFLYTDSFSYDIETQSSGEIRAVPRGTAKNSKPEVLSMAEAQHLFHP